MSEIKKTIPVYPDMAKILGIGKTRAYQLAASADFPSFKIGRKVLVSMDALDEWIKKQIDCKAKN